MFTVYLYISHKINSCGFNSNFPFGIHETLAKYQQLHWRLNNISCFNNYYTIVSCMIFSSIEKKLHFSFFILFLVKEKQNKTNKIKTTKQTNKQKNKKTFFSDFFWDKLVVFYFWLTCSMFDESRQNPVSASYLEC